MEWWNRSVSIELRLRLLSLLLYDSSRTGLLKAHIERQNSR